MPPPSTRLPAKIYGVNVLIALHIPVCQITAGEAPLPAATFQPALFVERPAAFAMRLKPVQVLLFTALMIIM